VTLTKPAPILIAGTGALANLFAARLSAAGHAVSMLGSWPDGLEALRTKGVRLHAADGGTTVYPVEASDDPVEFGGAKLALVLVKAWQTERVAQQLAEALDAEGVALTLQNGLGNREALAAQLGEERVAFGVTTTGANLLGPGQVQAGGEGVISLGPHPRLASLSAALKGAGFQVQEVENVESLAWSKLVINAAINPLTAVLEVRNGELLARPSARALLGQLAREVAAVAAAQGIPLTSDDPVAAAEGVAERTAANLNSMLQDVQRGAPTEIEAICGAVVRAGEEAGVPTPVNATLLKLVKAIVEHKNEDR
jgi:2-dehydropantoate 2-reductase